MVEKIVRSYTLYFTGDSAGATEASQGARTCNILGTVFGIITFAGVIIYYVVVLGPQLN